MTKQEQAEKEQKAFKWMQDKGYDRRACKEIAPTLVKYHEEQLILSGVSSSLPNVYEGKHNSARIKFYKHLAKTMNVNEYATRHIFNEACDWYKTLT